MNDLFNSNLAPRLTRLFAPDGHCLDLALDHGLFNVPAFLVGIEDMSVAVRVAIDARPDAIQLTPGQARRLQHTPDPHRPALVLRVDVSDMYAPDPPASAFSELIADPLGTALRLDAACVVINLFYASDQPRLHQDCLRNLSTLKAKCERYEVPLMVEALVMRHGVGRPYDASGEPAQLSALVRSAVELGADIIKTDPCESPEAFAEVVRAAGGLPVLPRGGGRVPDAELLSRSVALMRAGAAGLVYGRNITGHRRPAAMTRALMSIVHEGASAEAAQQILSEGEAAR